MLEWLISWFRRRAPSSAKVESLQAALFKVRNDLWRMRSKYDSEVTNNENKKHWANADQLSARSANELGTRRTIRSRARYEVGSNSYAKGMILTWANQLIGDGPTLMLETDDEAFNRSVERRWAEDYCYQIRLPDTLRTMAMAKKIDGEPVGILRRNPKFGPVELDLYLVECDQLTSVNTVADPMEAAGIHFDPWGNVLSYDIWRYHPGDRFNGSLTPTANARGLIAYDNYAADAVCHWFRCDRPGQVRGVSEISAALPLFAYLRRFILATINAAETAALFSVLLKTPLDAANADEAAAQAKAEFWSTQEILRGMMTSMPDGYEASQLAAEHPNSTIRDFVRIIVCEIARCLNMPYHVAAGDYADANYATARLGSQDMRSACRVERQDCEREVLDPVFAAWYAEALRVPGYIEGRPPVEPTRGSRLLALPKHAWHWPGWSHIDPKTEADANKTNLESGTDNLASICGEQGEDWKAVILQGEREKAYREQARAQARKEYGLPEAPPPAPVQPSQPSQPTPADGQDQQDPPANRLGAILNGKGANHG